MRAVISSPTYALNFTSSLSDRTGLKGENRERKDMRRDMEEGVKVTGQTDRVYLRLTLFTFLALILIMTLLVGGIRVLVLRKWRIRSTLLLLLQLQATSVMD